MSGLQLSRQHLGKGVASPRRAWKCPVAKYRDAGGAESEFVTVP